MSLKIKTAARLKALFAGVALSKKSVDAIGDQLATAGLTDEATDEEIDAKLNERNALYSFEDQKKFEDYQIGKATKEAADKEAARLKALEEGKPAPVEIDPNETATDKALRLIMEKLEKQDLVIAAFGQEKVATTRREQYAKTLEGTSDAFKAEALADFDLLNFKDDTHYSEWLGKKAESVKVFVQDEANNNLGGDRPAGGAGGKQTPAPKVASAEVVEAIMQNV